LVHLVDGPLDNHMRARFQGKRAGGLFEFRTGERSLDVSRARVMALN
jgi:hypothetical protein